MQKLFTEFKPVTKADWEKQLIKDLKGDSPEKLIWENENGFQIKPFYTKEDLHSKYEPAFTHSDWEICVHYANLNSKELNSHLLQDLERGATSISLVTKDVDFEVALKGVQLNFIQTTFYLDFNKAIELKKYLEKLYSTAEIKISLFPYELNTIQDLEEWNKVQSLYSDLPLVKTLSVDVALFHYQNALPYFEVALAFAKLNEMLLKTAEEKDKVFAKSIAIKTTASSDFFMQIAKLRAYRRLWQILKKEYQLDSALNVLIETSSNQNSISDRYNNLLRSTVSSMAAVIGGCDELIVQGFDGLLKENTSLSDRMAINQQLILKHESYLDKMADISCGSYYIECLTDELATKALETFKEIEKRGGYFVCMENNWVAGEIKKQAREKNEGLHSGREIYVGVNKFKNEKEKISLSTESQKSVETAAKQNPVLQYELDHFFKE